VSNLFLLLAGHALADYPLQGDFLAKGKNRHTPIVLDLTLWPHCLTAHSLIHGAVVYLITGSVLLGLFETVAHWIIDFGKGEGWYGFHTDQGLHVGCKLLWWVLA